MKLSKPKPSITNPKGKMILIDGDIPCYAVSSAADGKFYCVILPNGDVVKERYKTDIDQVLLDNKLELDYPISIGYDPDPIENAIHSVKLMVNSIIDAAGNGPFRIFISGKNNFREKVATIKKYKGNRDEMRRPHHLKACQEYLIKSYGAEVTEGEEADDALGIAQMGAEPDTTIICTIDKDLRMIPGFHYRWPMAGRDCEFAYVSKLDGMRTFYKQLMVGDSTDNIEGIPGVGKSNKGLKMIDLLEDEREMAEYVFEQYLNYELLNNCMVSFTQLKKDAYKKYLENGRLIWIRQKEGEMWEPPKKEK